MRQSEDKRVAICVDRIKIDLKRKSMQQQELCRLNVIASFSAFALANYKNEYIFMTGGLV